MMHAPHTSEPTTQTYPAVSLQELDRVAQQMLQAFDERVWCFRGELGSGKTALVKALCTHLGVAEEPTSPTYNLMHTYQNKGGVVYHFDLYRLQPEEIPSIGLDHYVDSGSYCFIEWPEIAARGLPPPYMLVDIVREEDETRTIRVKKIRFVG